MLRSLDADDVKVKSPYEELRDLILVETDLVVKYFFIAKFVELYCKIQLVKKYFLVLSNETNTPLLPTFYSTLAEGFRLNNYKNALDLVKKNRGLKLYGSKIIDEHSGLFLML